MVVFTAKVTRRKIVLGLLALCVIVCSVVAVISSSGKEGTISVSDEVFTLGSDKKIKDNSARVALLRECGWEVEEEPLEFLEVKIPEEFDGVYREYNELQNRQSLDLAKYCGKRVMRYTYKVKNHPSGEEGVVANLIFYKVKLIGGDISSPKLGGFMHGLLETSEKSAE